MVTFSHSAASSLAGGATVDLRLLRSPADPSDTCGYVQHRVLDTLWVRRPEVWQRVRSTSNTAPMTDAVTSPLPSPPTPAHSSAWQDGVVIAKGFELAHVSGHLVADPHSVDSVCSNFRSSDWL